MKLLLKARHRLVKKVIINRRGHKQTVYVRPDRGKWKYKIEKITRGKGWILDWGLYNVTMSNGNKIGKISRDSVDRILKIDSVLDKTIFKGLKMKKRYLATINHYTIYESRHVNKLLREGELEERITDDEKEVVHEMAKRLKEIVKANLTKEKVTLTRMIGIDHGHPYDSDEDMEKHRKFFNKLNRHKDIGKSHHIEKAFISASKLSFDDLASNFKGLIPSNYSRSKVMFLELEVDPGIGYLDINQSTVNESPKENEVILEDRLKLTYLGSRIEDVDGYDAKVKKYRVSKSDETSFKGKK